MPKEDEKQYDPRRGPRDRTLRVGDRERDGVAEILRRQHVEGRLDTDEFQERLERCLSAKTYRDLDELVADFPSEEGEGSWSRRGPVWPSPRIVPFPLLPLAILAAIVLSHGHLIWLVFPLMFFSFVWRSSNRGYGAGWACAPRRRSRTGTQV